MDTQEENIKQFDRELTTATRARLHESDETQLKDIPFDEYEMLLDYRLAKIGGSR